MKLKLYKILAVLMIVMLSAFPASARGAISLGGAGLGSLILYGNATSGGNSDYAVNLVASGSGLVACKNNGGNVVPGQNYPHIEERGSVTLGDSDGSNPKSKPGKRAFTVESANTGNYEFSWDTAGCPNSNWTAELVFVFWEDATLTLVDVNGNPVAAVQVKCETTYVPQNDGYTFDDGYVTCWQT